MRRLIGASFGIALLFCSAAHAGHTCRLAEPGAWVCTGQPNEPFFDEADFTPAQFRDARPASIPLAVTVDSVCPLASELAREVAADALHEARIEPLAWPSARRGWFGLDLRLECATRSQVSADLAFVDMINGGLERYGEFYLPGPSYDEPFLRSYSARSGRDITLAKIMEGRIRSAIRRFVILNSEFAIYQSARDGTGAMQGCDLDLACVPGVPLLRIEEETWPR